MMITLSFLELLSQEGYGEIDVDLFWNKLSLDNDGIFIADVGNPKSNGQRKTQGYELFARYKQSDVKGQYKLNQIQKFIEDLRGSICKLPSIEIIIDGKKVVIPEQKNISLTIPSSTTNIGLDAKGRVVFSITGTIIY